MRFILKLLVVILIVVGLFSLTDLGDDLSNLKEHVSNITNDIQLEKEDAVVTRVVDGDTLILNLSNGEEERVRLLLIDTPESVHPDKEEEMFGKEATEFAKEMLQEGSKVVLERGNPERDQYERLLGYIWIDGVNLNQKMIEKGFARVAYVYPPNTKYLDEFKQAEREAKEQKKNIWSIEGYVTEDGFDMSVVD